MGVELYFHNQLQRQKYTKGAQIPTNTESDIIQNMKTLNDYGFVRGTCYAGWSAEQEIIERDMGYAKRLQLNSVRIWSSKERYLEDPETHVGKMRNFIKTAQRYGLTTMLVLWNGNSIDESFVAMNNQDEDEKYMTGLVGALKEEEGLLMWDIINEPTGNAYIVKASGDEKLERLEKVWRVARHYCSYVKSIDPDNAITVGQYLIENVKATADWVDVFCFHDYSETRSRVEEVYGEAKKLSNTYHKPLINSETGCICRSNPYDIALEICSKYGVGWYLYELIIHGYWADAHGILYPDGTVRDPSIIAAILGFYRKRDRATSAKPNPNKEGHAYKAVKKIEEVLKQDIRIFSHAKSSSDAILEAAEYGANLLESAEMVPMYESLTMKITAWREQPEKSRDYESICAFAFDIAQRLKRNCQIL